MRDASLLSLLPSPQRCSGPSPPAQGCSVAAGHAQHHPAQGLGRSRHRTAAAAWWPPSCLLHSPQRSSPPGLDAPCVVPGTQCRPPQTWDRGWSGAQGVGVQADACSGSPTGRTRGVHSHIWLEFACGWELHVPLKVRTAGPPRMWVKGVVTAVDGSLSDRR